MTLTRRAFVERAAQGSVLSLTFMMGGASVLLTPTQARAQFVPYKTLSAQQVKFVEQLGEGMLPGAAGAGLAHFVDHQLGATPENTLLIAKYLQAPTPYKDFYAKGLEVSAALAKKLTGQTLDQLDAAGLAKVVGEMAKPDGVIDGFPIFLFYMCLRSDAVDVFYGTPAGFEKLNIAYMAHINPPERWDV